MLSTQVSTWAGSSGRVEIALGHAATQKAATATGRSTRSVLGYPMMDVAARSAVATAIMGAREAGDRPAGGDEHDGADQPVGAADERPVVGIRSARVRASSWRRGR